MHPGAWAGPGGMRPNMPPFQEMHPGWVGPRGMRPNGPPPLESGFFGPGGMRPPGFPRPMPPEFFRPPEFHGTPSNFHPGAGPPPPPHMMMGRPPMEMPPFWNKPPEEFSGAPFEAPNVPQSFPLPMNGTYTDSFSHPPDSGLSQQNITGLQPTNNPNSSNGNIQSQNIDEIIAPPPLIDTSQPPPQPLIEESIVDKDKLDFMTHLDTISKGLSTKEKDEFINIIPVKADEVQRLIKLVDASFKKIIPAGLSFVTLKTESCWEGCHSCVLYHGNIFLDSEIQSIEYICDHLGSVLNLFSILTLEHRLLLGYHMKVTLNTLMKLPKLDKDLQLQLSILKGKIG